MSMVRQIILAILATAILVGVGVGSYAISTQVIPDPTSTSSGNSNNGSSTTTGVTVQNVRDLTPKNLIMKREGNQVSIQFDTADKTGSVVYLTPERTERISQVVTDWNNGVPVKGTFYNLTPESGASTVHSIKIEDAAKTIKSEEWFFYVILMYKQSRIPYGSVMDNQKGPQEPYILKLE